MKVRVVPDAHLPEFSWATVPKFAFLSLTRDERLTSAQADYLATRCPIIAICKHRPGDRNTTSEQETLHAARQIKAVNPKAKVLFYWNTTLAMPGYGALHAFDEHDGWALRDDAGRLLTLRNLKTYDLAQQPVREWWSDVCREMTGHEVIDGVYADAVPKYGSNIHPVLRRRLSEERRKALADGLYETLKLTKAKIPVGKLLIFNGLRGDLDAWKDGGARYLDYTSGAKLEHFCAFSARDRDGKLKKEYVATEIGLIQQAARMGKILLVKAWPGDLHWGKDTFRKLSDTDRRRILREKITFPLAVFLVAAGERCYFSYSFGYLSHHGLFERVPELDKPLGPPKGPAARKGWTYTREFAHASVWVDIENEKARIDWRQEGRGVGGRGLGSSVFRCQVFCP
jgi:hypothetical protein